MDKAPKVRENYWFIGIKRKGHWFDEASGKESPIEKGGYKEIKSPEGTYWADPFLWENWLFFEDYDYNKGKISVGRITSDLEIVDVKTALEMPYHLSFPMLVKEGKEIYMIPEAGQSGGLQLFRAIGFPHQWEHVKTIYPGCFSDPVIFRVNGWWYIHTTQDSDHKLVILRSAHIEGDWEKIYHTDIMNSRPAGNVFFHDGMLIKPVQDGTDLYGKAVIFKQFNTTPSYKERIIDRLEPDWHPGLIGTHTYNFNDKYVVVDGKIKLT